jgi:hypothetical protein
MELRVFVGDESLGWSSTGPQAGTAVSATVEGSNEIRLEDGSLGRGFIFRAGGSTTYVAITPGGPVPWGEFVMRDNRNVTGIGATATFADIRKADGTLVPVSVGVRQAPSQLNPGVIPAVRLRTATSETYLSEFSPVRFRILEITPQGEPIHGKQTTLLRVAPHYGKIDTKSYDFRRQHETQDLTFLMEINIGYDIRTNDIISLQVSQHLKIDR